MIQEIHATVELLDRDEVRNKEMYDDLVETFKEHGGSPKVVGVVCIKLNGIRKQGLRYKIQYPDEKIDYLRVDVFDQYFRFGIEV